MPRRCLSLILLLGWSLTIAWSQTAEDFDETGKDALVIYDIVGDRLTNARPNQVAGELLELQRDVAAHEALWRMFADLVPAEQRRQVVKFAVFTDGVDENLASVTPLPEDSSLWILAMDVQDAFNPAELRRTLVHEFGHILTLGASQVPRNEGVLNNPDDAELAQQAEADCPQFFTGEGCSLPQSYINRFFNVFWVDIYGDVMEAEEGLYALYPEEFVSEYASSNPGEDITESWTSFVLDLKPAGDTIAEQKVLFFYDFPELVRLRRQLLENLELAGRQAPL